MTRTCEEPGCKKPHRARGMCGAHYEQWRKRNPGRVVAKQDKWNREDGSRMACHVSGCEEPIASQAMCMKHYSHMHYKSTRGLNVSRTYRPASDTPRLCTFPGCERPEFSTLLCPGHYYQKLEGRGMRPLRATEPCPVPGCSEVYYVRKNSKLVCKRHASLMKRFTLSRERLIELHQNLLCANPGCASTQDLNLDHDHSCCPESGFSCGECVRGWLCGSCNRAVGLLGENVERIHGLSVYLEESKKTPTHD